MSISNPVKTLNPEVARKIAAGEVIDRPNAIVRELMDNAIDSGASSITVEVSGGGIDKIRIVDNGCGLTKQDLENCARPHATSKISTETDLLNLSTLGFRGEALSSIAAVCRLSIQSGGYIMRASITENHIIEQTAPLQGTIVQAEGLFENFPARRVFLKRPASEAVMCKSTFIEKSLAYPELSFRFINDGQIKLDLPAGQSLTDRFVKAMEFSENSKLFSQFSSLDQGHNPDWSFNIVIGEPGVRRTNKKDIYIFVNGRKINEFSLQQAVEYGGQGFFPNGTYPVAAVFIQINPALVDFNIHPAKKEVRFKDISSLHHGISSGVRQFFQKWTNTSLKAPVSAPVYERTFFQETPAPEPKTEKQYSPETLAFEALESISSPKATYTSALNTGSRNRFFTGNTSSYITTSQKTSLNNQNFSDKQPEKIVSQQEKNIKKFMDKVISSYEAHDKPAEQTVSEPDSQTQIQTQLQETQESQQELSPDFKYIGCTLGTFILAEMNNTLFVIDQHAAHERLLFDQILNSPSSSQNLLIPYQIETKDQSEEEYLESIKQELKKIGFTCSKLEPYKWEFTTIHERWTGSELDLEHALFDKKVEPKDIIYSIAAMTACKSAVKDGYKLDDHAAEEIAKAGLLLEDPHCPHGRPVFTTITRSELFQSVRRTE